MNYEQSFNLSEIKRVAGVVPKHCRYSTHFQFHVLEKKTKAKLESNSVG